MGAARWPRMLHRFRVHARHVDAHDAWSVSARSVEAAAIAYLETVCPPAEGADISVIVRDVDTGAQHCLRIAVDAAD